MEQEKYFAYDKLEIPEDIQKMSKEELEKEIARLEAKAAERQHKITEQKKAS